MTSSTFAATHCFTDLFGIDNHSAAWLQTEKETAKPRIEVAMFENEDSFKVQLVFYVIVYESKCKQLGRVGGQLRLGGIFYDTKGRCLIIIYSKYLHMKMKHDVNDLVICLTGMSETVLASLVPKLDTLQHTKIQAQAQKTRALVEKLRDSLRAADAIEASDLKVEVWTNSVRTASYALEDVIDEFIMYLASRSNLRKNFLAKFHIKRALGKFRHSVENIALQNPVSSDPIHGSSEPTSPVSPVERLTHQTNDDPVGIEEQKNSLVEQLISEVSSLIVVAVVGMGGLGKTTLVKQAYHDPKIRKHFETYIWVRVPRDFKENEILKYLIQQLEGQNERQLSNQELKDEDSLRLKKRVNEHLSSTRYVIVLDGVWTVSAWHSIKLAFPDNDLGSRVIITTRSLDVAYTSCKSSEHIYNLPPLSEKVSRILFDRKAFGEGSCPSHLIEVSERILNKCGGVPIAILTIGGMLMSKATFDEWEAISRILGSHKDVRTSQSAYRVLLLCYNDLPFHLKACYLYLSIFPEDHLIECARLIHLWVAEGLVEVMEGKTPEDVAHLYITELLNRSLLQVAATTSDGRVKTCRIPYLLRTIILMKSRESNFVAIGEEHDESWSEEMRRLSIHNSLPSISKSQKQQIRSLLAFDVEESLTELFKPSLFNRTFKLPTFCKTFKILTVLDLKGAHIVDFPETVIHLFSLRYLSLRETKVKSVPNSIGMLQSLETLDLKYTRVNELPKGIVKLQKLRNLLLYRLETERYATFKLKQGFKAPKRVGNLQSLQKLCFIDAGEDSGNATLASELGKLTQLRRLGIVNLRRKQNAELCSSIEKLGNLRALSVTSFESEKMNFQHVTPPESLQRLYLIGQLESLPQWLSSLQNLVKIFLKASMSRDNPIQMLEELPNLVHIELLQAYDGKDLVFKAGTFRKLRILGLHKLESLERVTLVESSMPSLEILVLQDCYLLETVPSGIERLRQLKVFHLIEIPEKLINELEPPPSEGTSYEKVQHIPEVKTTVKCGNGAWKTRKLSPTFKEASYLEK